MTSNILTADDGAGPIGDLSQLSDTKLLQP